MGRKKEVFAINWMEAQALVEARHDNPHHILGIHECLDDVYINVFLPGVRSICAIDTNTKKRYTLVSDRIEGFFTTKIKSTKKFVYKLKAKYDDGTEREWIDPYIFEPIIDSIDISRFNEGIHYEIYEKLGAHPMVVDGISGVLFAVWAPNADRVSVVANFNNWDGRIHQMRKLDYSGIYELFIPGVDVNEIYKYEVRSKSGDVRMKTDPYGNSTELRPANASVIVDLSYEWKDAAWMKDRQVDNSNKPMSIYEVHLGAWKRPEDGREFYNYREIAVKLSEYMLDMGYTHVELMPVMEHPYDPSWGYQVTGYYAPTKRYGEPTDFMYFVDYMHKQGLGVIIDWVPAHFPKDGNGLGRFDGSPLYEHGDARLGEHPHWGTYIFNYSRNEVKNFLIANALYWADKYHVDGIRMDAVASMLYLDYGREDGQWIPNIYGGNENLAAIDMIKELNTVMKERYASCMLIAEESTAWPMMTHSIEEGGLGFDYKWNMGWMNDFLGYMKLDPLFRKYHHNELTFSMVYAYSEKFVLVLSHDEVVHEKGSMITKMPGGYEDKFSNLRVAYGFMMAHPGKKLLFMGQEFAQFTEFNESTELDWNLFEFDAHIIMKDYVKALNHLYIEEPALYVKDDDPEGFEWINNIAANESIVSFVRKSDKAEDTLVVVCNFTPVEYDKYQIGVPLRGKYKEIFSSDESKFGGEGKNNKLLKQSKKETCDDRENSITITVPPLSISIFKYMG